LNDEYPVVAIKAHERLSLSEVVFILIRIFCHGCD